RPLHARPGAPRPAGRPRAGARRALLSLGGHRRRAERVLRGAGRSARARGPRAVKPAGRAAALALLALAAALLASPRATPPPPAIRVDQVGYRPGDAKLALVAATPAIFAVQDAATGRIAFEGRAAAAAPSDPASGDRVATLDFTPLQTPGRYV